MKHSKGFPSYVLYLSDLWWGGRWGENLQNGLVVANLGAHLLDVLDIGIVGEHLAVQYLVEAGRRKGLYELPRLVGRACEAQFHGALEPVAGGGVFGHGSTCCSLRYERYG